MRLLVDTTLRSAKQRAHTATHLLHAALHQFFPATQQAGSRVDADQLRFDFFADRLLSPAEISQIETTITTQIFANLPVKTEELSYDEAIARGAKAFFEEKYGDKVRTVQIGDDAPISIELCGGTHVQTTSQIGAFAITKIEGIAANTRRIHAVTGPEVLKLLHQNRAEIAEISSALGVQPTQILEKISKISTEKSDLESANSSLKSQIFSQIFQNSQKNPQKISPKNWENSTEIPRIPLELPTTLSRKDFLTFLKTTNPDFSGAISGPDGSFVLISPDGHAKTRAQNLELRGGGSDTFFQGKSQTFSHKK